MALKSTDMTKNMAKKLDGKLKAETLPDRFGQASGASAVKRERQAAIPASKLVPVSYRLPIALINRMRDRAADHKAGINDLVAVALKNWLDSEKINDAPLK